MELSDKELEYKQKYADDKFKGKGSSDDLTLDLLEKVVTGVPREYAIKNLKDLRDNIVQSKNNNGISRH